MTLILRSIAADGATALADRTPARSDVLAAAAGRVTAALDDARDLTATEAVDWGATRSALVAVQQVAVDLQQALLPKSTGEAAGLSNALRRFGARVDAGVWGSVGSSGRVEPPSINASDRLELARLAMGEVRSRIAGIGAKPEEDAAVTLCAPIHLHLARATDALVQVPKVQRLQIDPELQALRADMEMLGRVLKMAPRAKWHREFATAFDAEYQLRTYVLGAEPYARPYSGEIDPQDALVNVKQMIADAEQGKSVVPSQTQVSDPQSAIELIESRLMRAYTGQAEAIMNFGREMKEDWPPSTSIWESIVRFALETVITYASGGVAAWIGGALLASSTAAAAEPERLAFASLGKAERETAEKAAHEARKTSADIVKSTVRSRLSSAATTGLEMTMSKRVHSASALGGFVERIMMAISGSQECGFR